MEKSLTIGRLARACKLPISTLRYYERVGLLPATLRSDGNYRLYGRDAVARVQFIRAAQSVGFTLDDVKQLLDYRDGRTAPCREVQRLIERRLSDLCDRLRQLKRLQKELEAALVRCRTQETTGRCAVMEKLSDNVASV
ncbi:MAG: MerR family DNA-binding protein [Candidatus Hydrogenedentes bacterium]|nr:MerR family DNA-binding protein [Candidatus Hydrogenedentota bacterium]